MLELREYLAYRILHHKAANFADRPGTLQDLLTAEGVKPRNVCVRVHPYTKARIDGCCAFLEVSVQDFVMAALNHAMSETYRVAAAAGEIAEFDGEAITAADHLDSCIEQAMQAEGVRLKPKDDHPDLFTIEVEQKEGEQ